MKNILYKFFIMILCLFNCFTLLNYNVLTVNAEVVTYSELENFVNSATITNTTTTTEGKNTIVKDTKYFVSLSFAETEPKPNEGTVGKQMNTPENEDAVLTYKMPSSFNSTNITEQQFQIGVVSSDGNYDVAAKYTLQDGVLTVTIDHSDPDYYRLYKAENVQFNLQFEGTFTLEEGKNQIDFGNDKTVDVDYKAKASVSLNKSSRYDANEGKFYYTVTATSTGDAKGVTITDAITGTLLTYNKDLWISSNTSGRTFDLSTVVNNDNGFSYTLDIADGEVVTFTYSASVDYSKVTESSFTVEETKNTVTATGGNTDDNKPGESSSTDKVSNTLFYKSGSTSTEGNIVTTTWTITVNGSFLNVLSEAKTLTDTLDTSNVNAKFTGEGLTIVKYKKNQNNGIDQVESKTVPWSEVIGDQQLDTATSWTYTVPANEEGDTTKYKYVITYTTETDNQYISSTKELSNTVTDGKDSSTGKVYITPGDSVAISKTNSNLTTDNVDYTVTVTLPKSGITLDTTNANSSLVITDELPHTDCNGTKNYYYDVLKVDSLVIKYGDYTLVKDTDYTVTYTPGDNVSENTWGYYGDTLKINISDAFITANGLDQKSTDARSLTLTYSTDPSDEWDTNGVHTNKVNAAIKGFNTVYANSTFTLAGTTLTKTSYNWKGTIVADNDLPYFVFSVMLSNVTSDTVTINDTFDTQYFEVVTQDYKIDDWNQLQIGPRIAYGDASWISTNGTSVVTEDQLKIESTDTGATLTLNAVKKEDGSYYNYYLIVYALKVKDTDALRALQQAAANNGGKYTVSNKANAGGSDQEATYEYTFQPLNKSVSTEKIYTEDSEGKKTYTGVDKATYTIDINKDKTTLNGGNDITVKDVISIKSGTGEVYINPMSVSFTVDPSSNADKVSYDVSDDGRSITFNIPDETYVQITYSANALSPSNFSYSNKVSMLGFYSKETESKNYTFDSSQAGSAETYGFTFIKLDQENQKHTLAGATYKLQEYINGDYKDVEDINGNVVTYTTDENGEFRVTSENSTDKGYTILAGRSYRLVEIVPPTGYKSDSTKAFTVYRRASSTTVEVGYYDYSAEKLYNGTTSYLYDLPSDTEEITLSAKKQVIVDSKSYTSSDAQTFEFELYKSNENGELLNLLDTVDISVAKKGKGTTTTSDAAEFDEITGLEIGTYYYAIKEVTGKAANWTYDTSTHLVVVTVYRENGVLTKSVTIDGEEVNEYSATFSNTYKSEQDTGSLLITKSVSGSTRTEVEGNITFKVVDPSSNETTYTLGDSHFTYNANTGIWTLKLSNVALGTYTVIETNSSVSNKTVVTTYSVNSGDNVTGTRGNVSVTKGSTSTIAFTNTYDVVTHEVEISKVDIANTSAELPGAKLKITDNNDSNKLIESWTSTDEIHKVKLAAGTYTLTETTAPEGYDVTESIVFTVDSNGQVTSTTEGAAEGNKVTMKDAKSTYDVEISKVDIADVTKELEGAKLTITDAAGKTVEEWTSTSETHKVKLEVGTYTLTETTAPNGYNTAESITFTVDSKGNVTSETEGAVDGTKVTMKDAKTTYDVEISKVDVANMQELPGALLTITDSNNKKVNQWTSTNETHKVKLEAGTYTLTETTAPNGYETAESITFTVDSTGNVTSTTEGAVDGNKVTMKDSVIEPDTGSIKITKTITGPITHEELEGALTFTITNNDTKETRTVTLGQFTKENDGTYSYAISGESLGTYTVKETAYTKDGYAVTVSYSVNGATSVTSDTCDSAEVKKDTTTTVAFKNDYKKEVEISKVDIADSKELEGAKLTITDSNGNTVDEWTSTKETHKVTLEEGKYTLTETTAPSGYATAEKIEFTVGSDGKVTSTTKDAVSGSKVTMKDAVATFQVEISKVDVANSKELPGAKLTITDKNGKTVKEWISTGKTYKVKLEEGTYTLTETTAPNGYDTAESIKFTVDSEGKVTSTTEGAIDGNKVTMKDKKSVGNIEINKTITGPISEEELKGSLTFTITSHSDPTDTTTVTLKDFTKKGDTYTYTLKDKSVGNYTVQETAYGKDGYVVTVSYTVNSGNSKTGSKCDPATVTKGETTTVAFKNDYLKEVEISKVDITDGSKELPGALLTITDASGETVKEWTSTEETQKVQLSAGTYTLTETTAPSGYKKAESITFTVDENGAVTSETTDAVNGNKVTMKDAPIEVTISKVDITNGNELPGALLTITDANGDTVEEWTSTSVAHTVKLAAGTYTLTETTAPSGYKKAESIIFTVDENGAVTSDTKAAVDGTTVTMKDAPFDVSISKVDATNGQELAGAKLTVKNSNGEVIDSWTSTNKVHTIIGLQAGTYTLTEITAPNGYEVAESIEFTIDEEGKVSSEALLNGVVVMKDARKDTPVTPTPTPSTPGEYQLVRTDAQ